MPARLRSGMQAGNRILSHMPGIAGVIGLGSAAARMHALRAMLDAMSHDPADIPRVTSSDTLGLSAGILGRPTCAHMETSAANNVNLLLYGYAEGLAGAASSSASRGALLHPHAPAAPDFPARLNGWFSGLLIDGARHRAALFNDRYGLARIYLHQAADGTMYFASEAKCILRVVAGVRRFDDAGLAEQIACGAVLQNRSLFRGITLLPPASAWEFDGARWRQRRYFEPHEWEDVEPLAIDEYGTRLKEVFEHAVRIHLPRTAPAGMSLTGGLDGRMIMAWAAPAPASLPCYTFGGPYRDSADVRIARRIAATCGQTHRTLHVGSDFFDDFPMLARRAVEVSDGSMDVSGAVELYMNELARSIAPLRITGSYGSEIVRGNVAFKPQPFDARLLRPDFAHLVAQAAGTYAAERRVHPLTFIAFKQIPWFHQSRFSLEMSCVDLRLPYLDNELVRLMYRAPPTSWRSDVASWQLVAAGNPALARIPTDRGQGMGTGAWSCARRMLGELTFKAEYAYDSGMPSALARIDRLLRSARPERLFLGRHKFYHFRVWYRDRFSAWLRSRLLDALDKSDPHFRVDAVARALDDHLAGRANHTAELHALLSVVLARECLLAT